MTKRDRRLSLALFAAAVLAWVAVVIVGMNRFASAYSVSMPGAGTSLRKSVTSSDAKPGVSDLSRSLYARS